MSLSTLCSNEDILAGFTAVHKEAFGAVNYLRLIAFVMRDNKVHVIGAVGDVAKSAFTTWCNIVMRPEEEEYSIHTNPLDDSESTWCCALTVRNKNDNVAVLGNGNSSVEALKDCMYISKLVKDGVINPQLLDCI